ncbi:MAG: M28 family peptidase [Bacteroidetes bacterium]|nr:M28 family peptidase [Bacteroidota bacterium]
MKFFFVLAFVFTLAISSCSSGNPGDHKNDSAVTTPKKPRVKGPAFSSDSAFAFVQKQVDFGPRIPGTPAHDACAQFFIDKLKSYGYPATTQESSGSSYDGRNFTIKNIFVQYKPERKERILLLAHWDTRPYADLDEDTAFRKKPFDGADDGGSSAAVLLEMAKIVNEKDPGIGVDFLFSDAEDLGDNGGDAKTWCIGTQYWAQHTPPGYTAGFAILLDMVGGKMPLFPREGTSVFFAPDIVNKVWMAAAALGYGGIFTNDVTGETTDDHLYINQITRIPCIDIVHYNPVTHDYPEWHHKHTDNMSNIDKNTLGIVGNVLVDVIYNENVK